MEFIIISGLSGAGKSKAASFMEDMGFFCVDNLPAPLIPKFAELGMAGTGEYDRVVLVTDVRSGTSFSALFQSLEALKGMKCPYRILYMDASDDVIIKRYKETRRSHPLAEECDSLEGAIALERRMLSPLRERGSLRHLGRRTLHRRRQRRRGLLRGRVEQRRELLLPPVPARRHRQGFHDRASGGQRTRCRVRAPEGRQRSLAGAGARQRCIALRGRRSRHLP